MTPSRLSRHSFHVIWTTATHCCTASATDYFVASSQCRTLLPAWSQAPVVVSTSHQCYGSCTGWQSVSESCSRSPGSYISRSLRQLPRPSLTTVTFCRTLVVAHCGPITMTCTSCSCCEHIIIGDILWNQSCNKNFSTNSLSTTRRLKHSLNFEFVENIRSSNVVKFEFELCHILIQTISEIFVVFPTTNYMFRFLLMSELWHCLILLGVLEVFWFYTTLIIFVDNNNNNNNLIA